MTVACPNMAADAQPATEGAFQTGPGRAIADFRFAVGMKGMVLGAIALVLLLAGMAAAITATVLSFQLADVRLYHAAAHDVNNAHDLLKEVDFSATAIAGTADAPGLMLRQRWQNASLHLDRLCRAGPDSMVRQLADVESVCSAFAEAGPLLQALLSAIGPHADDAPAIAAAHLRDLVDRLRQADHESGQLAAEQHLRLDRQQTFMLFVAVGTTGTLVSGAVLFSLVLGAAAQSRRRWLKAAAAERNAAEARAQLLEVIEAIPVGFGIYDRDERLMLYNSRLQQVNPDLYQPASIGTHIEDLLPRAARRRKNGGNASASADWIARQLSRFRAGDRNRCDVQKLDDGRWLEFYEVRTASGLTASVRVDVTDLKQREEALAAGEARYRQLVDSMSDVVFTADAAGRYTYVSAAVERLYGVKPSALVGASGSTFIHPDDHGALAACLKAARRTPGQVQAVTLRGGPALDDMRHLEIRFSAAGGADPHGRVPVAGVIRDVHRQVVLEQQRRIDMMKLRAIVESSGALILLVDRGLRAVLANRTFLEATGKAWDDVVYRQFDEVFQGEIDTAALMQSLEGHAGGQRPLLEFDSRLAMADGTRRLVRMTANPVHDETGAVSHVLFIGVDETARRSAEVQLIDAARLATVGQMATGIAHEINQPLTVIQFAAEALAEDLADGLHRQDADAFEAGMRKGLDRLCGQTQRAANIVRQLRIFARRPDERPVAFDAGQAIRGGFDLLGEQMRLARIDAALDVADGLPSIVGHPNRLQQVLINLAVNARDAIAEHRHTTGDEDMAGRLAIRASHEPASRTIVIEVADNGPGIPADVLSRLFEPFFTTKPSGKGTGLGLSISSEIVREMNGTITAENGPDGGALFRATFPAVQSLPQRIAA